MGTIRTPYLEDANYERRMNVLRQFVGDGLVVSAYRRNLERSVDTWFAIHSFARAPREQDCRTRRVHDRSGGCRLASRASRPLPC